MTDKYITVPRGCEEPLMELFQNNFTSWSTIREPKCSIKSRWTFCVMHLSAGTSPDIVRKWTGHKIEKTMRPYKGITERARKAAMPAIEQFDVFSEKKR